MSTLIMKFGGAAVASPEQFSQIARLILEKRSSYTRVAVVVSAMGDTTNQLIDLARKVNPTPPEREMDMLVSVGERISIALLAMSLKNYNHDAVSFTGSQSGIITCGRHTDARIIDVRPRRLMGALDAGKIVIVAGFQGVSQEGEITTLGRGGSDTTAVALGIALQAVCVEFYKDVPGIYEEDPKKNPDALFKPHLSYEEALAITRGGAKVLHSRCVELACKNGLPLHVGTFQRHGQETASGTKIYDIAKERSPTPLYEF